MSAHVCVPPEVTDTAPLIGVVDPDAARTSTGAFRLVVVPSASWLLSFNPQHFTPPENINAHVVWVVLPLKAVTPRSGEVSVEEVTTSTGVVECVFVPFPSLPNELVPQHLTPPFAISAHAPR